MGMFDYIKCEYPLPGASDELQDVLQSEMFQTKSFDCLMDVYNITKEGLLTCRKYELDDNYDKEMFKEDVLIPYHGYIIFYTCLNTFWYEYSASFVFGKLEKIVQVKLKKMP